MKILLLFIVLYNGEVKYRVDEFPDLVACKLFKEAVLTDIKTYPPDTVRIIRSECFEVGFTI